MQLRIMLDNKGVGLLEVLVSMIVLAIGLLGLAPMMVTSIEGNVIARDHSAASDLIKQKVEHFEGLDSLPATPYEETENDLLTGFSRVSRIGDHASDSTIPEGVFKVEVEVSWVDDQEITRSTAVSTFILKD